MSATSCVNDLRAAALYARQTFQLVRQGLDPRTQVPPQAVAEVASEIHHLASEIHAASLVQCTYHSARCTIPPLQLTLSDELPWDSTTYHDAVRTHSGKNMRMERLYQRTYKPLGVKKTQTTGLVVVDAKQRVELWYIPHALLASRQAGQ